MWTRLQVGDSNILYRGENLGPLGEGVIGFWALTNLFLFLGLQTTVPDIIENPSTTALCVIWRIDRQTLVTHRLLVRRS